MKTDRSDLTLIRQYIQPDKISTVDLPSGNYILEFINLDSKRIHLEKIIVCH